MTLAKGRELLVVFIDGSGGAAPGRPLLPRLPPPSAAELRRISLQEAYLQEESWQLAHRAKWTASFAALLGSTDEENGNCARTKTAGGQGRGLNTSQA